MGGRRRKRQSLRKRPGMKIATRRRRRKPSKRMVARRRRGKRIRMRRSRRDLRKRRRRRRAVAKVRRSHTGRILRETETKIKVKRYQENKRKARITRQTCRTLL